MQTHLSQQLSEPMAENKGQLSTMQEGNRMRMRVQIELLLFEWFVYILMFKIIL